MMHNIIAVHSKDGDAYKLKTFHLRQGSNEIDATPNRASAPCA